MEENMVTPYEYIRMVIEEYGDETDLNKYDNLIGDYKQLFELVKRLQKENEELHKEIDRMKSLDIYKLVEDWETGQLIPRQKIKDKIEYLDKQQKQWLEDRELKASDSEIIFARNFLQELLKESEK